MSTKKATPESVEVTLRAAIVKAMADGVRLTKGVAFVGTSHSGKQICACAVGCVVIDLLNCDTTSIFAAARERLDLSMNEIQAIACGFDGVSRSGWEESHLGWLNVGTRLREEFNPMARDTSEDLDHAW